MSEANGASRVLIVDDNSANAELLQAYLADSGYRLSVASCGADALKCIRDGQPDMVLLDIMMPDMSGYEVCRRIKTNPDTRDIPVIMVTALTEVEDVERGVDAGTDDFLSKPVNRIELVTRVKSLLRLRHLKSELERTLAHLEGLARRE